MPEGREVDDADDAWDAAEDIGVPVCVKPTDGNHGRGVFIDLTTKEEVFKAYAIAVDEGSGVLVERSIPGIEHRLLVVGGKLVAANRSDLITITGDGKSTVEQLIESQVNTDPRRGTTELHPLSLIRIDTAARIELERQGLTADSVPAGGREVLIQRNANHAFDCTDEVHPETAELASLAARVVGLDISGVDLVCEDISKPLADQGGAIVEVNAGPSLLMHIKPGIGKPRPVGQAIVNNLFASEQSGRVPLVGVTGTHARHAVAHLVAHLVYLSGKHAGLACRDGIYLGRRQVQKNRADNWEGGRRLLLNRAVQAAVIENGAPVILGEGLPYDRCSVGIITNIVPEDEDWSRWDVQPTGGEYYTTPRSIFRSQVDVVLPDGHAVLNAEDELVADFAELCDGEVIFFACDPSNPTLLSHLTAGKRGVTVVDKRIVLRSGADEIRLCRLIDAPYIGKGKDPKHLANVLAGVAGGWAMGLSLHVLTTGIKTFSIEMADPAALIPQLARNRNPPRSRQSPGNNKDQASWKYPAFVPCAAPTCGAGTLRLKPLSTAVKCLIEDLPGFEARLRARFPEIGSLEACRSRRTISMAHALEFAALGLQVQAGCPVTFSRTAQTSNPVCPGGGRIHRGASRPARVRTRANNFARQRDRCALRPRRRAEGLRELDEEERLGPGPAPSFRLLWPAAFPIAA